MLNSFFLRSFALIFVGYFTTQFYPSSSPVGKSNVTIRCLTYGYYMYKEITLDIRQNMNEDFISVLQCNQSGIHRLNNNTEFEGVNIVSFRDHRCLFGYYTQDYIEVTVSLHSDECVLGPQTSASWRCLFSNGTYTFNSSEKNIYSVIGMNHLNILA